MPDILALFAVGLLGVTPAMAQDHQHHTMAMSQQPAVTDYYAAPMAKMHKDMMVAPTGNADVDFMRGMIPHHQGAVDMAKIVLEKGKDPEVKKFAADIIAAQEKEITYMKDWLAKHEGK